MQITKTTEKTNSEPIFKVSKEHVRVVEETYTASQLNNEIAGLNTEITRLGELVKEKEALLEEINKQITKEEKDEIEEFNNTSH
jgi:septal ring factor EnvC (AmiA/AmiB activator)